MQAGTTQARSWFRVQDEPVPSEVPAGEGGFQVFNSSKTISAERLEREIAEIREKASTSGLSSETWSKLERHIEEREKALQRARTGNWGREREGVATELERATKELSQKLENPAATLVDRPLNLFGGILGMLGIVLLFGPGAMISFALALALFPSLAGVKKLDGTITQITETGGTKFALFTFQDPQGQTRHGREELIPNDVDAPRVGDRGKDGFNCKRPEESYWIG